MAKKEIKTTAKKAIKRVAAKKIGNIEEVTVIESTQSGDSYDNADKNELAVTLSEQKELSIKNDSLDELLTMSEEEVVDKAKEKITETKNINNNRANQKIDNIFGYLWNGQEMDY